ncbi:hypothetical protein IAT40_005080 [Kwoniella sp. CBS 6097]
MSPLTMSSSHHAPPPATQLSKSTSVPPPYQHKVGTLQTQHQVPSGPFSEGTLYHSHPYPYLPHVQAQTHGQPPPHTAGSTMATLGQSSVSLSHARDDNSESQISPATGGPFQHARNLPDGSPPTPHRASTFPVYPHASQSLSHLHHYHHHHQPQPRIQHRHSHSHSHSQSHSHSHSMPTSRPDLASQATSPLVPSHSARKRPRQLSILKQPVDPPSHPPDSVPSFPTTTPNGTSFWTLKPPDSGSSQASSHRPGHSHVVVPAVLTREKKQKACSNCRRAKLKCIVEHGEAECVRCKVRKEKCVFFPRASEDDWQQAIASDFNVATRHLANLSDAVHHILDHLVKQNMIPPFTSADQPDGLERYIPPDRDPLGASIAPVTFAKTNNTGVSHKRPEAKNKRLRRVDKRIGEREAEDQLAVDAEPAVGDEHTTAPQITADPSTDSLQPSNQHSKRPSSEPDLPQIVPPPMRMSMPPSTMVISPPMPQREPPQIPPRLNTTSSAGVASPHWDPRASQSAANEPFVFTTSSMSDVHTDNPHPARPSTSPAPFGPGLPDAAPTQEAPNDDLRPHTAESIPAGTTHIVGSSNDSEEDDSEIVEIGSRDPRTDIVKKQVISGRDALALVKYFHSHISVFLYGYNLQFQKFPYIGGPSVITPLLLAVLCLISSERFSSLHHYHPALAEEVSKLLSTSPAESWQTFEGSSYTADFGDVDGDDPLDAEFGLGPEEIVAACVLATYMTEREEAVLIARSAFRWARGWIMLLSSSQPRVTIAETVGFVPPERPATPKDMARIWLLCYIVDSTERLQLSLPAPPPRDAQPYLDVLVPPELHAQSGPPFVHPQDVVLTIQASLLAMLNEWRGQLEALVANEPNPMTIGGLDNPKTLARTTNEQLDQWRHGIDTHKAHSDPLQQTQQTWQHIDITWLFVKMSVNGTLSTYLTSSSPSLSHLYTHPTLHPDAKSNSDKRLRDDSRRIVIDSARGFMQVCRSWTPKESLTNLSPTYLFFVTLAASELVEGARQAKDQFDLGQDEAMGLGLNPDQVIPLIRSVGEMLFLGDLHQQHVSRTTAKTLFYYCEQLQKLR